MKIEQIEAIIMAWLPTITAILGLVLTLKKIWKDVKEIFKKDRQDSLDEIIILENKLNMVTQENIDLKRALTKCTTAITRIQQGDKND